MIDLKKILIIFLCSFGICFALAFPVLNFLKRLKIKQSIHEDVIMHKAKEGTPTMGGLIFIIPLFFSFLLFRENNFLVLVTIFVTVGYGLIGFLDDFIKIYFKRNLGLRAYQKIIGQGGIALIVALICYFSPFVENKLILPFSLQEIELGFWVIPLVFVLFLACTNAVNLTDGLDGLAGGVSFIYLIFFGVIISLVTNHLYAAGVQAQNIYLQQNLLPLISIFSAGILAFLVFNSNKAKVFMGDVGSLSIGAFVACLAAFTNLSLFVIIAGGLYVISTLSVIIQVLHYKRTKCRFFLMAPLHHHFEKKGVNESKIVSIYVIVSIILGGIAILSAIA